MGNHPYLALYLAGCVLVLALTLFKIILVWAIGWLTKGNIVALNIKKLQPHEKTTFSERTGILVFTLVFEAALSWINVAVCLWQIASVLLTALREALTSTPEAIQKLR